MHIRTNRTLNIIFRPILVFCEWLGENYPKVLMRIRYFAVFHRRLNLKSPKTLNEKILYLSLCTDTSMWTTCADKYSVRNYVKECGLSNILVDMYGVWDNASDIDFDKLPDRFVLKGTHGCDDVILIEDKNKVDKDYVKSFFAKDLKTRYGAVEGGIHYLRISPRVIAEEFISNDSESQLFSSTLIDYKVWCFNGKPYYIWTVSNRDGNHKESMLYDTDWIPYPHYQIYKNGYVAGKYLPRPKALSDMLSAAEKLASPFPIVRVDFYNVGEKLYFGELTFTSHGGLMINYTEEFQNLAGSMIDLTYPNTLKNE